MGRGALPCRDEKRGEEQELLDDDRSPLHPMRVYRELAEFLDRDAIVVGDGGDFVSFAGRVWETWEPGTWMDPGPYGCLGAGPRPGQAMTDQPKQGKDETPEGYQPTLRLPDHQPDVPAEEARPASQDQGQSATQQFAQPQSPQQPYTGQQQPGQSAPDQGQVQARTLRLTASPAGRHMRTASRPTASSRTASRQQPYGHRRSTASRAPRSTPTASRPTTACRRNPRA